MLTTPTPELVRSACEEFDRNDPLAEQALAELFTQYPKNGVLPHVLLKVVTLNELYATQIPRYSERIPDLIDVAQHIHENAQKIDSGLADGLAEIVELIGRVKVRGKQDRYYFSFATKYCSWHKQEFYPIYDSRVERYVNGLKKDPCFREFFGTGERYWSYSEFRRLINLFRDRYGLNSFSFKEIDKFLYKYGSSEKQPSSSSDGTSS